MGAGTDSQAGRRPLSRPSICVFALCAAPTCPW